MKTNNKELPGGEELQLLAKQRGAAGAAPPQGLRTEQERRNCFPGSGELQLRTEKNKAQLEQPLLRSSSQNKKGAAGAAPPQRTREYYKSLFTTHFGFAEEWNNGGNLPHRNSKNLIQSITFRLADSMPQNVLKEIEEELKALPTTKREIEKRRELDKWLDKGLGSCALGKPTMAKVVWDALQYYNGDKYNLLAWSIMPNHVHVLIETAHDLSKIVQSWKSYTGRWALANNKKYGLGIEEEAKQFWRSEYWDRFIRDEAHFDNVVRYILENPKNAKLSKDSVAYEFTGSILVVE